MLMASGGLRTLETGVIGWGSNDIIKLEWDIWSRARGGIPEDEADGLGRVSGCVICSLTKGVVWAVPF